MRRGAVLLFSLIVMSVTLIVTGALCSYYVNTASIAKMYADERSSRRVGATRAVRTSMDKVMTALGQLAGTSQSTPEVGINIQGKNITQVLEELRKAVPSGMKVESETYTLTAEIDTVKNTLKISAMHSGIPVVSGTIELETPATSNTLPVFDYVYFADNNGQLNSGYIIANGSVGSNGNFDLKDATVNGYLRYLNTLYLSGEPHAWLQGAYNAKISAEFDMGDGVQKIIEQARPTNPAPYVENGETKYGPWDGGYECVYGAGLSWTGGTRPSVTMGDPTNDEPQPPDPPQRAETTSKNQPSASSSAWEDMTIN